MNRELSLVELPTSASRLSIKKFPSRAESLWSVYEVTSRVPRNKIVKTSDVAARSSSIAARLTNPVFWQLIPVVITRLSSWEGWYRKSTNQIARLPVWYFPCIRPVPCVSDRKSNFSKWRMRRRSRFANFLLETQRSSCPGDEGPQFELGLDM